MILTGSAQHVVEAWGLLQVCVLKTMSRGSSPHAYSTMLRTYQLPLDPLVNNGNN